MTTLEKVWREAWPIPDRREIFDWAAVEMDFKNAEAFKGKYNVDNVPWTKEPLRALKDITVRMVTCVMPPQISGKTIMSSTFLCHRISTDPTKMSYNLKTDLAAKKFKDTRWEQIESYCKAVQAKKSDNEDDDKRNRIIFKDKTFLIIQGAEVDGNRQSDTVEVQVNDECHLYERPWMKQLHTRTDAYAETCKILNISIGGQKGSELEEYFLQGSQEEWSWKCPNCGEYFSVVFDKKRKDCNIFFDLSKVIQFLDGRYDLREFSKTIYVECPHCRNWKTGYDAEVIASLNKNGKYVAKNPDADMAYRSFHIGSFMIGKKPWHVTIDPWVRLHLKGESVFAQDILKNFICENLAEFWEDKPVVVSGKIKTGTYTRQDMIDHKWADEWLRVILVDNQRGKLGDIPHRWFVCRAFDRSGNSRLVDCGRINEWSELRKRQLELGVPDPLPGREGPYVMVDRRYDPTEVDKVCANYQWYGSMGSDYDEFSHGANSQFEGKRLLYSECRVVEIGYGSHDESKKGLFSLYYMWSSQKFQDLLSRLRAGKAEAFEVPSDIQDFCPEYAEHMNSHKQVIEPDKKGVDRRIWKCTSGWPDHLYDCETQCVVIGVMAGLFKYDPNEQKS